MRRPEMGGGQTFRQGSALEALYAALHAISDDRWHPMMLGLSFRFFYNPIRTAEKG
jgi:hypothetical protein